MKDSFISLLFILIIGVFVVLYPGMASACTLVVCLLLLCKLFSVGCGISWLWNDGPTQLQNLVANDESLPPNATHIERRRVVFDVLKSSPSRWWLCGVIDWRWFKAVDDLCAPDKPMPSWLSGQSLRGLRLIAFRFEVLLPLGSLLLAIRNYSSQGHVDLAECIAFIASFLIVCVIIFMSVEVLVGNIVLGRGYSRYFHLRLVEGPLDPGDRRDKVREVLYFFRLVGFSLVAFAAICMSYYATYKGFSGILTSGWEGDVTDAPEMRLRMFSEFFSFVCTTFATVGYGDVFPNHIASRLIVSLIHLVTMAMVLVLLQIVMTQNDLPKVAQSDSPTPSSQRNETGPTLPL